MVGYSERGFGLELNPIPLLVEEVLKVGAVAPAGRIGVAGDFSAAVAGAAAAPAVEADDVLHEMSLVKDGDELTRIFRSYEMCWLAHAAVAEGTAAGRPRSRCSAPPTHAAQVGYGSPVEFGADLLAGPNTAEVCAPVAMAGPGRAGAGEPVVADLSVGAGGYWADTCRTYVHGSSAEVDEIRAQLYAIMDAAAAGPADRRHRRRGLPRHQRPDRGGLAGWRVPASCRARRRAQRVRRPAPDPGRERGPCRAGW